MCGIPNHTVQATLDSQTKAHFRMYKFTFPVIEARLEEDFEEYNPAEQVAEAVSIDGDRTVTQVT